MRIFNGFMTIALLALAARSGAQTFPPGTTYDPAAPERRGQAGMTFLQVGASARAEALGGAFVAVRGDASSIFYNPAGMADVRGLSVYAGNTRWIGDVTMSNFVLSGNAYGLTFGSALQYMDYGDVRGTVFEPGSLGYREIGNVSPNAWTLGGFVAARLTDRFNTGVQVKYAVQDFGGSQVFSYTDPNVSSGGGGYLDKYVDNRVGTWLIDLGTQYNTGFRNISVNMSFQHFGRAKRYYDIDFDMPLTYHIGMSGDIDEVLFGDVLETQAMIVYVEGVDRRNVPLDYAAGVEYIADLSVIIPDVTVALRGGRRAARHEEGAYSAGVGLSTRIDGMRAAFDYSYSDYGMLDDVHRLGISIAYR